MSDDGTLSGVLADSLKKANFTEDVKAEVQLITEDKGITELYQKYGMIADKNRKSIKVEKTLEQELFDEAITLVSTYKKLTTIRSKMVAAGQVVDPSLDEMVTKVCEAAVALAQHPIIAAKLKDLENEPGSEVAAS